MSDGYYVHENKGGDFERVPCGMQNAVAARLYDLGMQPGYQGGKPTHQIVLLFEMAGRYTKGYFAGQRFRVTITYNASLGSSEKPSKLRGHLESWRGRGFTQEELARFDLRKVLGHGCTLSLIEKVKGDGKKFAQIAAVMPAMPNAEKLIVETPVDFVPDWVAKKISEQLSIEEERSLPMTADGADIPF
jgi:hypothetical protein